MKRASRSKGSMCLAIAWMCFTALGCSSSGGNKIGDNFARMLGRALAPENEEAVPLANETVVLLTYDEEGNLQMAEVGTTDENGEFEVDVEAQAVIALVVSGMTEEGEADISGLFNPEPDAMLEKVLDPPTSIACVAGLSAIGDGSITPEQLDEERVQNLEDAADGYVEANPDFDFYDSADFDAAVNAVRTSTDDGANPAT
jgi:hypothetical protein